MGILGAHPQACTGVIVFRLHAPILGQYPCDPSAEIYVTLYPEAIKTLYK